MSENNIATLRDQLFKSLATLSDTSKPVDVARHRLIHETAKVLVDSVRVEVELAMVMKGALDVPFIEAQANERPALPAPTAKEKESAILKSGPSADHFWRRHVHQLKR